MRLDREFTIATPLDRAWPALADADTFAACVPGGDLRASDGVYAGELSLAAGEATARCAATLRALDVDEDEHATTVRVTARQIGGSALAAGTIASRLEAVDGSTRVALSADIALTGHAAAPEAVERRAQELFHDFVERLEARVRDAPSRAAPDGAPPVPAREQAGAPERARAPRYALGAGALVLVLALLLIALGRRRRP